MSAAGKRTMGCTHARRFLSTGGPPRRTLRRHLETCEQCAEYEKRLESVHRALAAHHTAVVASPGFAGRVQARLQPDNDSLGWAALRLLPATLGLVLLLSWLNLRAGEPVQDEVADPTTAMLSWVLEDPSGDLTGDTMEDGS